MGQAGETSSEERKIQHNHAMERARQWLSRGRKMEQRLAALQKKYQQAYERATTTTTHIHTAGSGKHTSTDDRIAAFAVISVTLEEQIAQLQHIHTEILQVISQIEDNILGTALTEYYINDHTWEEIAEYIGYSVRHMTRLHRRGLEKIIPLLPKEKEDIN